jgi:membrane fusion protein, heavy metal efflux system
VVKLGNQDPDNFIPDLACRYKAYALNKVWEEKGAKEIIIPISENAKVREQLQRSIDALCASYLAFSDEESDQARELVQGMAHCREERPRSGVVRMKSVLTLFGVAFILVGCNADKARDAAAPNSQSVDSTRGEYVGPNSKGIQTQIARTSAIPDYLELPAHIEADPTRVVHVFAPAGGRMLEMKVRPWDRVEKGQTLATLESSDLARAVANYHKALADDQVKQKALARSEDLLAHHAISEREYQQTQADAGQAKAEVDAAREQVQVFGMDPDRASIELVVKAPRSGVVLEIGASSGEFSQALSAASPLCTIADIGEIWAVGDIYERDLSAAKSGQDAEVTLNAYPNQHWSGRVGVVSSAVDPVTRTLQVRVVLPNSDAQLKPGMFGGIRILRSTTSGIVLPATAVLREGNDSSVFVARGNGRFERRSVKIGRSVDGTLEILSGVNAGDTIVSDGALLLRSTGRN